MQGLAMLFGASRGAWIVACVVQGVLFGGSARLPESFGHRDHRDTWRFDGTSGSRVRAQSLADDHRSWTFRRESFRFVLFRRPAGGLSPSAIQQTGIEAIFDRLANLDFIKIRMSRI